MIKRITKTIRKSLVIKTTLLFLFAAIIPYIAATLLILNNSERAINKTIIKGLSTQVSLLRDNIDLRLFSLKRNASAWADLEAMEEVSTGDAEKRISRIFEELKNNYGLSGNIHAVNRDGLIVSSSNPSCIGRRLTTPWLPKLLSGMAIELDFHASEIDGSKVITFGAPVRSHSYKKQAIGGLIAEYTTKDLELPSSLMAAVINDKGEVVVASGGGPFLGKNRFYFPANEKDNIVHYPLYVVAYAGSRGYHGFKGFGWTVATAVKERKARKPVINVEQATVLYGLLGITLIIGLVSFFSSKSIKPLKDLSLTAEGIARTKDFTIRVRSSSDDEIGRLADTFNNMIEEINDHIKHMKEMEEILRRTDRLTALGELSAGMAHEIKNPLGIIKSSADILKKRPWTDSSDSALLAAISEESDRLTKLLNSFLQFARPRPPRIISCNINEVLDRALNLLTQELNKTGILLYKKMDHALHNISTDPDQLHQVFINIIINAMHAMPDGGTLSVATRKVNDSVEISISDTGSGINPDHKEKIFNPFFSTKERGTGLGLSIVHSIIAGLGGQVKVEDGVPSGTCFKIYLPIKVTE